MSATRYLRCDASDIGLERRSAGVFSERSRRGNEADLRPGHEAVTAPRYASTMQPNTGSIRRLTLAATNPNRAARRSRCQALLRLKHLPLPSGLLVLLSAGLLLIHPWLRAAEARLPSREVPRKIGLLLPPEETEAEGIRRGVTLAMSEANRSGGPRIELVIRGRLGQWGTDGDEAAQMALDDEVDALIAPTGGAATHLILQVAGRTLIPVVSLCGDSSVTQAGIPWLARVVPGTVEEAQTLLTQKNDPSTGKPLNWSALVPDLRAGREIAKDLLKGARSAGANLAIPVELPSLHPEEAAVTRRLLESHPNGILIWLEPRRAGVWVRTLRAAGYRGLLAGPGRLRSESFLAEAGSAAMGFCVAGQRPDGVDTNYTNMLIQSHLDEFQRPPDAVGMYAFDAARILVEVLRRSGDQPPRGRFPLTAPLLGATGPLKFDRQGNRQVKLQILTLGAGRFEPLSAGSGSR